MIAIRFTLNGKPRAVTADPTTPLLRVLPDNRRLTGQPELFVSAE